MQDLGVQEEPWGLQSSTRLSHKLSLTLGRIQGLPVPLIVCVLLTCCQIAGCPIPSDWQHGFAHDSVGGAGLVGFIQAVSVSWRLTCAEAHGTPAKAAG